MAQIISDQRDMEFALYEQLEAETLCNNSQFSDFNKKTFNMILNEARNLAIKEILPTFTEGDREGLRFENNQVFVPDCFKRPYKLFSEGEWVALTADPELGGQGLPNIIAQAINEFFFGANTAFGFYPWASFGAGEVIEKFGTDLQKELFVKKMYSGEWGGTMVLTEPEAGSDVGNLSTLAKKNWDGTYTISGNKIFITNAEQDLTDNIVHLVLARIEGAPKGTKGVSLFVVPKIWVNEDGTLGELNDAICTGIEHKLGITASATCAMSFGTKGNCRGTLLGEENKGMQVMFHMMNAARLVIGCVGFSSASAAYLHALEYSRQRRQGKALENMKDQEALPVPIINHPDVRRMLLWMKCHIEGMRSLLYYGALCLDKSSYAETQSERTYSKELLDLLTPIIKAYCTDRGFQICSEALQVFGGYGYTKEYPVEQLLRDARIAPIYEGTNGIQGMDLLGRKMGLNGGKVFVNLIHEIEKTIALASQNSALKHLATALEKVVNQLGDTAAVLGKKASSPAFKTAFAHATPFQDAFGDVIMAWMLLWRASIAEPKLSQIIKDLPEDQVATKISKNKNAAFYKGQIISAQFFIETILPVTLGKLNSVSGCSDAASNIPEAAFGS